jgi:hypothetical protein
MRVSRISIICFGILFITSCVLNVLLWRDRHTQQRQVFEFKSQLQQVENAKASLKRSSRQSSETTVSSDQQLSPEIRVLPPFAGYDSKGTINRFGELKHFLILHPELGIPEFKYLTDDDWLSLASVAKLDTDAGNRNVLSLLRQSAKQRFFPILRAAELAYATDHGGLSAKDPQLLYAYLPSRDDVKIMNRYVAFQTDEDWCFIVAAVVDESNDTIMAVSPKHTTTVGGPHM